MPTEATLDPNGRRMIAELRELAALTSDDAGAQRVAWTNEWIVARHWLSTKLKSIGLEPLTDPAQNMYAVMPGKAGAPTLLLGSHLDSVPDGGWLDGALGVVAALEVVRSALEQNWCDATLILVDWADEEGSRFGHSLFGSSAATGQLDAELVADLKDADDRAFRDVAGDYGVVLSELERSADWLQDVDALLELHIEQGPVLEDIGRPLGVPRGSVAVDRLKVVFRGQAAHSGTTPMHLRQDAAMAAARLTLIARDVALGSGGLATVGQVTLEPSIATAVPERVTITIDLRHENDSSIEVMRSEILAGAVSVASEEGVSWEAEDVWAVPAVLFDDRLIASMSSAVAESTGGTSGPEMVSGALHDAVAVARSGVPAGMLFVRSIGGLSHSSLEDSSERDLELALQAYATAIRDLPGRLTAPR